MDTEMAGKNTKERGQSDPWPVKVSLENERGLPLSFRLRVQHLGNLHSKDGKLIWDPEK